MRLTREKLLKFAEAAAAQRSHGRRGIICVYLTGSLRLEDPLIGGTTDIDLIFIHDSEPPIPHEVAQITEEVSLDIAHYNQSLFRQPRSLRSDPWLGSSLCENPILLHQAQHWFEFTRASVEALFHHPENVVRRARPLLENARQQWMKLSMHSGAHGPEWVATYLSALEQAANAVAILTGEPLPLRRLMIEFPQRCAALDRPGLAGGLVDLFTPDELQPGERDAWLTAWRSAYAQIGTRPNCPPSLRPERRLYYDRAVESLWEERLPAALWILLNHWTEIENLTPPENRESSGWYQFANTLLLGAEQAETRLDTLDAYLDSVEETVEQWAAKNGIGE